MDEPTTSTAATATPSSLNFPGHDQQSPIEQQLKQQNVAEGDAVIAEPEQFDCDEQRTKDGPPLAEQEASSSATDSYSSSSNNDVDSDENSPPVMASELTAEPLMAFEKVDKEASNTKKNDDSARNLEGEASRRDTNLRESNL